MIGPKQNVPAAPPSPLASSPPSLKLLSPSLFTQSHRFLAVTQQPHPPPPPSPCRRRKDVSVGFVNLRNTAAQPITSSHRCARSYSPVRNAHTHSLARSRFGHLPSVWKNNKNLDAPMRFLKKRPFKKTSIVPLHNLNSATGGPFERRRIAGGIICVTTAIVTYSSRVAFGVTAIEVVDRHASSGRNMIVAGKDMENPWASTSAKEFV